MGRPLLFLLLAAIGMFAACNETPHETEASADAEAATADRADEVARVIRGIEPEPGSLTTAQLTRVEIQSELRTVAMAQPRFVPRWRERIVLEGDTLAVDVLRPTDVALSAPVQVDVMISTSAVAENLGQALETGGGAFADPGREWIRTRGMLDPGATHTTIELEIPEALRGDSGLLDVILRPLAIEATQTWSMEPFKVEADHVLRFGYGVEEPAWEAGWPAAAFKVEAISGVGTQSDAQADAQAVAQGAGSDAPTRVIFERHIDPAHDPRDRRWHDAYVPLDAMVGQRITLRFSQTTIPTTDVTHSLLAIANPTVVPARRVGQRPPARDVILVSLDTLRAASVSSYGYVRPTTPRIDELVAARGVRFATAYAPRPYTPPSHMTMLTGLHPCAHGVKDRHETLGADRPLLAERLRAAGYQTAAFTENANVAVSSGFARGFDHYSEVRSEESATPGFATETFGRASDWVRRVDDRPFFLFVHTYQVHDPYEPPSGYAGVFGGEVEDDAVPPKHREKRNDYDREIRFTDEVVADFLGVLDQQGLGDAIVIITSDHGEQFGEHFFVNHGFSTYEEAIRVPFFVRAPTLVPKKKVIDVRVGLADIVPTVLDLLGLPTPTDVQGRSLAPLILDADAGRETELRARHLYASAGRSRSIMTEDIKVTLPLPKQKQEWAHVFDLSADPLERENLAEQRPLDVEFGRSAIESFEASCAAFVEENPSRPGDAFLEGNQPAWMINRDVIEEKLRSLGYVE